MKSLALIGNPNVGKSVLFGHLTGKYVHVANYPGTTVELAYGHSHVNGSRYRVIDTPGIHSLLPITDDEKVTRDIVVDRGTDSVIQVADSKNLRRSLFLSLQLRQMGIPFVLVLNMEDEAASRGIRIDRKRLSVLLGVPVVKMVATKKKGLNELRELLVHFARPSLLPRHIPAEEELRLDDGKIRKVDEILAQVLRQESPAKRGWKENLGSISMHPVWGIFVMAGVLFALYEFVGKFGAQVAVDWLEKGLFGKILNPFAIFLFSKIFSFSPFLRDLFVGKYGMITMGLTYALGIILPIVTTFFLFFSLLEDCGYLPRLSVMLNRIFRVMGLNGKAVVPMVLGLGCDTMATMSSRIMETKKEKVILTLLLALGVPCSAQLGIILGMLASLPSWGTFLWGGVVTGSIIAVGFLAARILPGGRSDFIAEIPPIRRPTFFNIAMKTIARLEWYLKEVIPLFVIGTLVLFLLDQANWLIRLRDLVSPFVVGILGLPYEAADAFLIGFLRRDYGATHFFDLYGQGKMDPIQTLVSLVVITLFVPCLANILMIVKERGIKTAVAIIAFIYPYAFVVGGILNATLRGIL